MDKAVHMKNWNETFTSSFLQKERLKTVINSSLLNVFAFLLLLFKPCFAICARAEYEINGECCPMCAPGNHVYRHCTEYTSTTCVPCTKSTYTAEPNGLLECLSCTVCDTGQGIQIKMPCTLVLDTVCGALDGYYCIDRRDSCRKALSHSNCSPGQYIRQRGTEHTDTVCDACPGSTFSNGSFEKCQPHLKCKDLNRIEVTSGTNLSDVVCGAKSYRDVTAGVLGSAVVVVLAVAVSIFIYWKIKMKEQTLEVQETDTHSPLNTTSV
ncbi:tumor necrosis factor receptor superfamily member 14-like [Trichomycterus rosablanca]|uniref:tumor necrosis factor receptor superfamily member 14-like n=1 Tax=Trichomycterus rosablanca TaxID=2290929 RepID=UPI002F3530BB